MGGEVNYPLLPRNIIGLKNFFYHLIYVSKVYIPNLRPLVPPLHLEKFVVGGWWWVVVGGGGV